MHMYGEISWTEFPSEYCKKCALNVTEIHAINPICVHCSRVKFVQEDLFVEKKDGRGGTMSEWVKGRVPTKSGNYAVRYNGKEGRDDFTVNGNHWWNTGNSKHPEEVEWRPDSYKEL